MLCESSVVCSGSLHPCCSFFFFFSSRRRHTRCGRDWSSDVCSSDLLDQITKQRSASPQPRASDLRSAVPDNSSIDPGPLNAVLSMNGEVRDGVYRAAIGRKTIVRGVQIDRKSVV